ncbi:LuxR C-terminal-related transcriptional regulator [Streptomyces sp. NPDC047990]|uniref:LuxR C-terminal-related transcriptional regulator n=1 Tax=Streptomyces sp. NPDC047990 TaxID=3365496 RepID=UPI00371ABB23
MRNPGYEGQQLSAGQLAALRLSAAGFTSKQIAGQLDTTEQGIHLRLKEAMVRLGAETRTHAVVIALRRHIITFDEVEAARRPARRSGAARGAQEPACGARGVRCAARPPQGRTEPRGEAAA